MLKVNVEKQLFADYKAGNLPDLSFTKPPENVKALYSIRENKYKTDIELFEFIDQGKKACVETLKNQLIAF